MVQNPPLLSYASKEETHWHKRPWYITCLSLATLSIIYSMAMLFMLPNDDGWARLALFIFGVAGLFFQLVLGSLPVALYGLLGRCRPAEKTFLLILGFAGPLLAVLAIALAIALPNRGGC